MVEGSNMLPVTNGNWDGVKLKSVLCLDTVATVVKKVGAATGI